MRRLLPLALLSACHGVIVVAERDSGLSSGTSDEPTGEPTTAALTTTTTAGLTTTTTADDTDDDVTTGACELPPALACDEDFDPLRALGLDCPGDGAAVSAREYLSPEPGGLRTARQFANAAWNARAGLQLLALSTGLLPQPDPNGKITVPARSATPGTANENPEGSPLPAPADPDSLADHWQTKLTHDLVALRFDVVVPASARGFALDLAFMTAEFPQRADQPLGDALVVWTTGEAFTGDLASLGTPVTVLGLRAALAAGGLVGDAPALLETGFDGLDAEPCDLGWISYPQCPRGAALAWSTLRGPVSPGERLAVVIALADLTDAQRDTVALLDGWRWTCDACVELSDAPCGLAPAAM